MPGLYPDSDEEDLVKNAVRGTIGYVGSARKAVQRIWSSSSPRSSPTPGGDSSPTQPPTAVATSREQPAEESLLQGTKVVPVHVRQAGIRNRSYGTFDESSSPLVPSPPSQPDLAHLDADSGVATIARGRRLWRCAAGASTCMKVLI